MKRSAKGRRCPAVQREISPAECGENRLSRYACPADCPYNPVGPTRYDDLLELEKTVIQKSLDWFLASVPNRAQVERELARLAGKPGPESLGFQVTEFFFRRDAAGRTVAERWADAGFPGLKNDERYLQRAIMGMRLRLAEVHRVIDDQRVEVLDLLETGGAPFVVFDRSLASQACRFWPVFGWYYDLPHYTRAFGTPLVLPTSDVFEPVEVVTEIVRHLGGSTDPAGMREWVGLNYGRFAEALHAVSFARRDQMFASLDADFGKAVYELRTGFAECRRVLDEVPAVAPDPLAEGEADEGFAEARIWFDDAPAQPAPGVANCTLGRVLLGQAHWRLEAFGTERLARLRGQFEAALAERVRFAGERRDDLAAHLRAKEPKFDRTLVPPRLLEQPSKLHVFASRVPLTAEMDSATNPESTFAAAHDRAWIDSPLPALDGKTPREAANDPALRPALLRLLKDRVRSHDERNRKTGDAADINWLLAELGAHELIFDPPPPRAPLEPDEDDALVEASELQKPPPLPSKPFSMEEAAERLLQGVRFFETAEAGMNAMAEAGSFLIEDIEQIAGDLLNEDEYWLLAEYLMQVWYAFVPPGCWGPEISTAQLHAAFGRQLEILEAAGDRTGEALLEQTVQPALVRLLAVQLLDSTDALPPNLRPRNESRSLMLVLLRAAIEELDAALRELYS